MNPVHKVPATLVAFGAKTHPWASLAFLAPCDIPSHSREAGGRAVSPQDMKKGPEGPF